jgi:thiol:disulfide interchange protein DsbA
LSSKKGQMRLITIRNGVIAFVVVVVAIVVGYGLLRSTAVDVSGEFVEGTHYRVIDGAVLATSGPIRVTELFSYGCVHCRNFDPMVAEWVESKPDWIEFDRIPVTFSPVWAQLAQAYFALLSLDALEQNHARIFAAIHDNGKQFLSPEMIADFVDGHGVTREAFLRAYSSPEVSRAVTEAAARERRARVNGVPAVMVEDYYMVDMNNVPRKKAFEVAEFLARKIRDERGAP